VSDREFTAHEVEPMMREQALLEAVIANPDDDAPRLAYADWLESKSDPRAEFIRAQLELASTAKGLDPNEAPLPLILHRKALKARQEELLDQHGRVWLASLPQLSWGWSRGFVEGVTLIGEEPAKQFLAEAEAIFRLVPLRAMHLGDDPGIWETDDYEGRGPGRYLRPESPISLPTLEALIPSLLRLTALSLRDVYCARSLSSPLQQSLVARFGAQVIDLQRTWPLPPQHKIRGE
jgi:uncharacterized protein (TIGR02996 family)